MMTLFNKKYFLLTLKFKYRSSKICPKFSEPSNLIFKNFSTPHDAKNSSIEEENFTVEIKFLNDFSNFSNFFSKYEKFIESNIYKKLLFIDYLSMYFKKNNLIITHEEKTSISNLVNSLISDINSNKLNNTESIYVLSLLESLSNLNFYPEINDSSSINKLWINLQSFILNSNFIKNTSIENFNIILKAFQKFFSINNTIISAEEIFEALEYQIILVLKNDEFYLNEIHKLEKFTEIFILFSKNLEGSRELYNLMIKKIFTQKNIKILFKEDPNKLVGFYFSLICISIYIDKKNKEILNLIKEIDNIVLNNKNNLNEGMENILKWCIAKRRLKN